RCRAYGRQRGERPDVGEVELWVMTPFAGVVGAVASLERDRKPAEEERCRTGLLEVLGDAGIDAMDRRRDHDDDEHTHRHAENGQPRANAIRPKRLERDADAFEERGDADRQLRHVITPAAWRRSDRAAPLDSPD